MDAMIESAEKAAEDPTAVLMGAADAARVAIMEFSGDDVVGEYLGAELDDPSAATHRFLATMPGYQGWQWAVVVAAHPGADRATISEVVLVPGPTALLAPQWVPWHDRVLPGDLSPGDLLSTPVDDPRLVPGYVSTGDDELDDLAPDLGFGRRLVLSQWGRVEAAQRWYDGEHGPESAMARATRKVCRDCAYYLQLSGSLGTLFGVCANEMSADAQVVAGRIAADAALVARRDATLARRAAQLHDLRRARRQDREELARLDREAGRQYQRAEDLVAAHQALSASYQNLANELNAIRSSTSWVATRWLRTRFTQHPGLRKLARRSLKLAWWVVTLKLARKLAERSRVVDPPALPPNSVPGPDDLPAPLAGPVREHSYDPVSNTTAVFVSGEAHTPGHTYRIARNAEAARMAGATVQVLRIEDVDANLDLIRRSDLVFLWRAAWSDSVGRLVGAGRAGGAAIVFDVDDLMFEPELATPEIVDGIRSQNIPQEQVRDHFGRLQATLRAADFCTAPTPLLAHRMRRLLKPAFVLPNGFDDAVVARSRLAVRQRRKLEPDGLIRIGYATGSKTHQNDFAEAASAVAKVLRAHPECRLVLFEVKGQPVLDLEEFPEFEGLEDQVEWRHIVPIEDLPAELVRFDVNIAPLQLGNLFCEAKSELKFFEAALVGVPTVASPTEPYRRAIRNGENGFLAASPDQWAGALERLVADAELRRVIARKALYDSLVEYGEEKRAERMVSLLEQTVGRGRRAARAFELDLARSSAVRPPEPHVPAHEIVLGFDKGGSADVTVLVPLYNYAAYIEAALESVAAQTAPDLDLIVVDDASTDDSRAVAKRWLEENADRFNRVLLIANTRNAGLGFTRNVGFFNAETPYVLPLDADNRLLPECVEQLTPAIRRHGAAFAYSHIRQFGDGDAMMGEFGFDPVRFVYANYIDAMALIRRSGWVAVGGYDHVRFGWEDYDLWCRFVERGLFGEQVRQVLAEYRVHGQSMLRTETNAIRNKGILLRDMERRHQWLRIDRKPIWGPALPDDPAPAEDVLWVSAEERIDGQSQDSRLDTILPLLRCPVSGESIVRDGDGLRTESGTRTWPLVLGRPILFEGFGAPRILPAEHISNPLPDRAISLITSARGPVLNLSAGGTSQRFDHVIEVEASVFGNTDVIADAHALPFADESFDLVLSFNAFEHYQDPGRVVREIARVLRPGGQIFLRTAFLQPLHEARWHLFNCTKFGLQKWFEGFEGVDIQVSDTFNPIYGLSWQLSEAERLLRRDLADSDADGLLDARGRDLVAFWREPSTRGGPLWKSFTDLPQAAQEHLAAGFELLGRKPA